MKRLVLAALVCLIPVAAAETSIELDPARTFIRFTIGDVLHTVHGRFKLKRGAVKFDPTTGNASGEIVVDVASGDSGNGGRDERMHREILESAIYPEAVFTSDHVSGDLAPRGESQISFHGSFRIHGAAHELTLRFVSETKNGDVMATTGFVIPYVQDAEDIVQDSFLKAYKAQGSFRGSDSRVWMMSIVRNTALDYLRRYKAKVSVSLEDQVHEPEDQAVDPECGLLERARREQVREAISHLESEFREVIVLREMEGLSYKEIAAVLSIPMGTVMSRLSRARNLLLVELGGAKGVSA